MMASSLLQRRELTLENAKQFYDRGAKDMYPFSKKYDWIIGSNNNKIQSMIYTLKGVDALKKEPFDKLLQQSKCPPNTTADHEIYEQHLPHYGYGKITFPENIQKDINDSLHDNPAWKALKNKEYETVLPIYIGGGVSKKKTYLTDGLNKEYQLIKDEITSKRMCVVLYAIDDYLHPSSAGTRINVLSIKNQLLSTNDIVISSIYRVPFMSSLGPLVAIVICLTTYKYQDFLPKRSAKLCYSSAGSKIVRGLWQCTVYEDVDDAIKAKRVDTEDNLRRLVAVNIYPALVTDMDSLQKAGVFDYGLMVESMGNVINVFRGLLLAFKLGFDALITAQPLALAQLLFLYKYKHKLPLPNKLYLMTGGYLCAANLRRYIMNVVCKECESVNWVCYYGTTDFMAACLKTCDNECNGFLSIDPQRIIPSICRRTSLLQLSYVNPENGQKITVNTKDPVKMIQDKFYIQPRNELENWIINEWDMEKWTLLTGNAGIESNTNIIYLQSRYNDSAHLNYDFDTKLPCNATRCKLISFNEFQARFGSNMFQRKASYLYYGRKINQHAHTKKDGIQYTHLSQLNHQIKSKL